MHAIHSIRLTGMLLALSVSVPLAPDPPVALAQEPLASTAPDRRPATIQRGGRLVQTTVLGTELAPDGRPMRAGGLIVKFRPDAAGPARESAHRGAGVLAIDTLGLPDTGRVQVRPGTTARAIAAYRSRPDVEFVEPHYVVRTTHTTNDPGFAVQWNMTKIGMPSAWDREQSGSSTRIAILDCGIYSSSSDGLASDNRPGHPDIRDKVVLERDFTASPTGADDLYHHGTHVAGVAAASTNNGLGVAGVGYNSGIMNGKVLGDDGAGSVSTVVGGIVWAADNGAKVINMSLGRDAPCVRSEADAVNYAWQRGVVIVAAAGNESTGSAGSPGN